jgi:CYTH domain-containing protein
MIKGMLLGENNVVNGKSQKELEYTFVGYIDDLDTIVSNASHVEIYEQWWMSTDDSRNTGKMSGTFRVRSINNKKYTMTIKERSRNSGGAHEAVETEVTISKDMFESFKKLAPMGIMKTRYSFPIPNSNYTWEIDVFTLESGDVYDWCKMDLEVKNELKSIPEAPKGISQVVDTKDRSYKKEVDRILQKPVIHRDDSILPLQR